MPIVEVSALPQAAEIDVGEVSAALAEVVASELAEPASGTWVVWTTVEPGRYAEGGDAPAVQPPDTHPPLVRVIAFEGRPPPLVHAILGAIGETLVARLRLAPGNAFVLWDEAGAGRLYTGGSVVDA